MEKYVFRRYNPEYKKMFRLEKSMLEKILPPYIKIEHVGSTSISGLGGKGIIDILIGVDKRKIKETKERLKKINYEFHKKASTNNRLFFRRYFLYNHKKEIFHVHLTELNSKDWKEIIAFRNYLKKSPKAIKDYINIKTEAVRKAKSNGKAYRKYKEKFIKNIILKALKK